MNKWHKLLDSHIGWIRWFHLQRKSSSPWTSFGPDTTSKREVETSQIPGRRLALSFTKTLFFDSWYFSAGTRMPSAARPSRSVNCQTGQGWISYGGLQRVPGRRSKQLQLRRSISTRKQLNTHTMCGSYLVHIHLPSAGGFYFVKSNGYSIRTVWLVCLICFITQKIYLTHKNIRE